MYRLLFLFLLTRALALPVAAEPAGMISGHLHLKGKPAAGIRVSAIEANAAEQSVVIRIAVTDSTGRYQLSDVRPGRYLVAAGLFDHPTYFPGVTRRESAKPVVVAPGATADFMDFMVSPGSVGELTISGRVIRLDHPPETTTVFLRRLSNPPEPAVTEWEQTAASVITEADGSFQFTKVWAGDYGLTVMTRFTGPNVTRSAGGEFEPITKERRIVARETPITALDTDVTGLELVVPRTQTVRGTVKAEGTAPVPYRMVVFMPAAGGSLIFATHGPDSFAARLFEGEYTIAIGGAAIAPYFIKSVLQGDRDVLAEGLALQGSDSPPIVVLLGLSSPLPRIVGSLSEVQNLPREDMPPQILLREDPALTQGLPLPPPAILQSDGSFEFPMVVPGQYVLCVKGGAASCAISPTFRVSAGENVRVDMVIPAVSASPGGK